MDKGVIYKEAIDLLVNSKFQQALDLINKNKNSINEIVFFELMGNYHFYRKEYQPAMDYYEKVVMQDNTYRCARYYYLAGLHFEMKMNDLEEAEMNYRKAIETESNFIDAHIELGGLLGKKKEFEESLKCYKNALEIDPTDLRIYASIVNILRALQFQRPAKYTKEYENAVKEYQLAKKLYGPTSNFDENDDRYTW